ncbi:hypothetical protein IWQ60_010543 [Tieghemiomyces parasiticus]|uniref:Protein kinase domain-containing protein n=1 Tax=Tieghemiomyces parasiticus TaxID=78921 RepID=A0A9W8DNF0_9FUNG|nr:hypothetical protein IWQ60_010543 [Tieghemiomyces parasiticus]
MSSTSIDSSSSDPAGAASPPPLRRRPSLTNVAVKPTLPLTPPGHGGVGHAATIPELDLNHPGFTKLLGIPDSPVHATLPTPQPSAPSSLSGRSARPLSAAFGQAADFAAADSQRVYQAEFRIADADFLGEGQLAKVYRATFRPIDDPTSPPRSCVVKLIEAHAEAWQAGLSEARLLRHLQNDVVTAVASPGANRLENSSVVRLLGVTTCLRPTGAEPVVKLTLSGQGAADLLTQPPAVPTMDGDAVPYLALVLEYCEHGDLWSWIQKHAGEVGLPLWLRWTRQLTTALETLHAAGYVHGDLKPHNVLLTADLNVRLADLGSAWQPPADGSSATPHPSFTGMNTVAYTAPELLNPAPRPTPVANDATPSPPRRPIPMPAPHLPRTAQPAALASDIFSLGILFYIVGISGEEPYAWTKSPMELMLAAMKGAFWDYVLQKARMTGTPTRTRSLHRRPEAADSPLANRLLARHESLPRAPAFRLGTAPSHLAVPGAVTNSAPTSPLNLESPVARSGRPGASPQRPPADLPSLFFLNGDPVPIAVVELLHAMMAKLPEHRLSPSDILRELDAVQTGLLTGSL